MDQLRKLIAGLSLWQRVSVVAATLAAGALIAALVHFHTEGSFRPLYTALAPEEAALIVQKLKESGVEYRLAGEGTVVLVPDTRLAESRLTLAGAGLPKSGRIGFELFDKTNFGATELVEHINYQRALEGELERSVMSMAGVVQARVHLTLPKDSVFLDQQQPAKASVMLKLRPGARISPQNVTAVCHLVSSAVENLAPDAVSVLDMDGNLLSRPKLASGDDTQTSESLELRRQIERDLVTKVSTTLEPLLGANRFRVGASVDCDPTSAEQQEETFDPDKSVMLTSQKSEDASDRAGAVGGIPGTPSNLPHPPAQARVGGSGVGGGVSHRTENITYESSRVVRHTKIPQGVVRRMSLSVLVDQETRWEGAGKNRRLVSIPPKPETLKSIREVIAGITGFNAERGDQLIVETLPFESGLVEAREPSSGDGTSTTESGSLLDKVSKNRSLILTALLGLAILGVAIRFVARLMPRKSKAAAMQREIESGADAMETPALAAAYGAKDMAQEIAGARDVAEVSARSYKMLVEMHGEMADRVRQMANQDLVATANVLRMWVRRQESEQTVRS
jgi:flagellar M-ring protein FliF